ncbi:MAG: OmpA family protein [Bacteroidales bacterium]|nr:OmpA family protein [Bacteroidales bacterium]
MKRLTMIAASLLLLGGVASAQQSKTDETLEFRPHWSLNVQGGVAHTRGESEFSTLLSPAAQLSATYRFHHAMGVRFGFGGWQGKGAALLPEGYQGYAYQFAQLNADYILDLAGVFGGFNHKRVVSPYILAGVGAGYGFNNEQAAPYKDQLEYYWDSKVFAPVGRAGLGIDFRLGECVSLGIEGNTNILSDKFNSKKAENVDWQFNVLAGLSFRFGKNTRPSVAYAEKVAAEAAAAAAAEAAARAEAERLAAEKAAAEKAAAEKAAREKAEAERLAAEKAAAERAAKAAENSDNVFFTIGSTYIRKAEDAKLVKLAEWMKANPDFNVSLVGYADRETGTPKGNEKLSAARAKVVKDRLVKLGVEESRIMTAYKGDTVQPFAENAKNRVVMCTLE